MPTLMGRNFMNLNLNLNLNLNRCFTNFRRSVPIDPSSSSSSSSLYPNEEHPNNRSISNSNAAAAAAADSSSIVKNFNSLYDLISDPDPLPIAAANAVTQNATDLFTSSYSPSPSAAAATPDLTTVLASRRFFVSSPGRSNSIIDSFSNSSSSLSRSSEAAGESFVDGGVAIPTYSPDPYVDFRRSMEEMVEARRLFDVRSNWECLHELLLCYLALNPKSTHKFIVGAFSDLLVSLMDYPAMSIDRKRH